ncbi:hypothetical protein ccbrp13_41060 [Ktedonobacteria bacterium brp13]|nr:hypothetical protein ccbrp13_41060 [Ktedonobacteria bacterium brp13]
MVKSKKLSDTQRALLKQYVQGKHAYNANKTVDTIPKRQQANCAPLSFGQQQMWLLAHLIPDVPVYNESVTVRIPGPVDVHALEQSLNAFIARHELWRTTFPLVDDEPMQVVQPELTLEMPVVDLRSLPAAERETRAVQLATEQAIPLFDLTQLPLLRATLIRLDDDDHRLYLTIHHILFDGVIYQVLVPQLYAYYTAFVEGKPSPLPPLPIQYGDYAIWQREQLQSPEITSQIAYWKQQLADAPVTLDLPTDHPYPAVESHRGARLPFTLSAELIEQLTQIARSENATLYHILAASFNTLLYHYTGQTDMLTGAITAGRRPAQTQDLIGVFLNPLVIRNDLSGNPTFREQLLRVRDVVVEAQDHQDVPFEYLVKELRPQRDPSRNPLIQVLISLQPPLPPLAPGWTITQADVETKTAKFELSLILDNRADGFVAWLEYNTDLFEEATAARLIRHWQMVLNSIVADPSQPIADIAFLTPEEQQTLLHTWNATQSDFPAQTTLHTLIEQQVERTPDAIALSFEGETRTYRELNNAANHLARQLQVLGAGPDTLIGVSMERSIEMVEALLAVLKSGGAYVPLDPSYPADRLAYMLQDANVPVLLTQPQLKEQFLTTAAQVITLDAHWDQSLRNEQVANPESQTGPEQLAYMIYTSGSTGKPKGVMNTHRGISNRLHWMQQAYQLTAQDRVMQKTPFSFDVSVWEFFWPLLTGARLVVARPGGHQDPAYLAHLISEQQITTLHFVPSMLQVFLQELGIERSKSLRQVVCSGEALTPEQVQQFFTRFPQGVALHNLYGPTEAAIDVTSWECSPNDTESVPIGRPIANTQLYILNAAQQPVPAGLAGELFIGGVNVARGYHNRPELTAEKFIDDPFSAQPGAKLFRTADLARYRQDGAIEFLGRIDHQVKIRGFRIELGEIEMLLRQVPEVEQAIVTVREDVPGDKRLVAYITPSQKAQGEQQSNRVVQSLQQRLRAQLPEYMLPSTFVQLTALPVSPNGKIDRRKLPAPDTHVTRQDSTFVAPRTPLEEMLEVIWTALLNVPQISVHDNFFEAGGHSLLAMQMVARIRTALQIDIAVHSIFTTPTIATLAARLQAQLETTRAVDAPALVPIARAEEIPASFDQRRLWFLNQINPKSTAYNIPLAIRIEGPLVPTVLEQSINALMMRHETLRTTLANRDGRVIQIIAPSASVELPVSDLRTWDVTEQQERVQQLMQQQEQIPFDLSHGPLLRAHLLQLDEQVHILHITIHHTIFDGWSTDILLRDLRELYHAQIEGKPAALPTLPIQYADYAHWQQTTQAEALPEHLAYWQKQLADTPPLVTVPADRPRPEVQTSAGAFQKIELPVRLQKELKALSQREGVTLFMTLLAAFQVLLMRSSGQQDIVVGTPIANRTRPEVENLIGFFANTLALRSDLSGNPSFRHLLAQVRDMAMQAYAHQDLPFEKVVESLQIERSLSANPLFQVMFAYQKMEEQEVQRGELSYQLIEVAATSSKFDIFFEVQETEQGFTSLAVYNTDLYDTATIERFLIHWQELLQGIVANADQSIETLPLLSQAEREQLLITWNQTAVDATEARSLHQMVEDQVERSPREIAVSFEQRTMSYQELNQRANQLARHLDSLGIGPDVLVGVCMERSLELVVAILAILKAGGAYVPLDPGYPADRLAYMIEDAQISLVLTQNHVRQVIAATGIHMICLDEYNHLTAELDSSNLHKSVQLDNLAYLIYTSGSTGKPKGAMNTHRNIYNQLSWRQTASCRITAQDRILHKTSFSFDVSVWEFFWPLIVGARIVIARPEGHRDPAYLKEVIIEQKITTMHFVPSMLQLFLQEPGLEQCSSLRQVMSGGEALTPELQQTFFARFPEPVRLYNMYGPAETAIDVTAWECRRQEEDQRTIPIGYPITNTQMYILDPLRQPVPIGVAGELYIGGMSVGRGYYRRPDLTRERFIPDPFSNVAGARLYKTGDLARYRADGAIEYLGRIDYQVKLRGFRIELGEIEALLQQQAGIQQVVVIVREDKPDSKQLVAYLVADQTHASKESLYTVLKEHLPEYMVPSAFVFIDALPLTPGGKVDRRGLPAPDMSQATIGDDNYSAPTEIIHYQLLNIWEELLVARPIGIKDNFFHLGGHSLLAARLVTRIEQVFGKKLSLSTLFAGPTIANIARELTQQTQAGPRSPLIPVQTAGAKKPFFFLHGDWTGGAYYCFKLAKQAGPDQPFYVLEPSVFFEEGYDIPTIEMLAASYLKLVRSVQPKGPYYLGGYCNGGMIAYEMAQQLQQEGQQVEFLLLVNPASQSLATKFVNVFDHTLHLPKRLQWKLYLQLRHVFIRKVRPALLRLTQQADQELMAGIAILTNQDSAFRRLIAPTQTLKKDYSTVFSWALEHYRFQPYPGKITYLWSREDLMSGDKDAWLHHVQARESESFLIPGTHYSILTREIEAFARSLGNSLQTAQAQAQGQQAIAQDSYLLPGREKNAATNRL